MQTPGLIIKLRPIPLFRRQSIVVDIRLFPFKQQLLRKLLIPRETEQRALGVEASGMRLHIHDWTLRYHICIM